MNASAMATKLTYALTATKKGAIAPRLRDYMHSDLAPVSWSS